MIGYRGHSAQRWSSLAGVSCAGALAMIVMCSVATAADPETREFAVYIDKKLAGTYTMTISQDKMEGHANVDAYFYGVVHYVYRYDGTETWKDNHLQTLSSKCNDDGTRYAVQAQAQPGTSGLAVSVNSRQRVRQNDVWTTTYWRLPANVNAQIGARQAVNLLDADSGKDMSGTLEYKGQQQVYAAGGWQKADHYRLTGEKLNVKLWYDASRRLVREESVEGSHTYILQLKGIR
jgi:Family of unknown function (DUF6134)